MNPHDVVVCRTGTANLASVMAGLRRGGGAPRLARSPGEILEARHVMLPGVGSFGAAMETLARSGAAVALKERMIRARPTLAICVGLQLLARQSEESPGVPGLGLIDDVNVNCVVPGQTKTDLLYDNFRQAAKMDNSTPEEVEKKRIAATGLRRFGEPEDIANLVAFLVSPVGRHVHGAMLPVDGGTDKAL